MNRNQIIFIAAMGSFALLFGAFGFQYFGYAPCKMCLWQRWPHGAAIIFGVLALLTGSRLMPWLGALAAATTGAIGLYHAGVEQKWWEGPTSCTGDGSGLGGLSGAELLSTATTETIVMCDEIVFQFLGLTMAGWNAALSFYLVAVWLVAARRR